MSPATSWPAACGCTLTPPGTVRREAPARSPARTQPAPGSATNHAAFPERVNRNGRTTAYVEDGSISGSSRRLLADCGRTESAVTGRGSANCGLGLLADLPRCEASEVSAVFGR